MRWPFRNQFPKSATLRILSYLKPYRFQFSLSILGLFATAILSLAFPWLLAKLVGETISIAPNFTPNAPEWNWTNNSTLILFSLLLVNLFQGILIFWRIKVYSKVSEFSLNDIRSDLFAHILHLPMDKFYEFRSGELTGRLTGDLSVLRTTFIETLPQLIRTGVSLVIGGIIILCTSAKLSLFSLLIFPLIIAIIAFWGRKIRQFSRNAQDALSEANISAEEAIQSIRDVKGFHNENFEIQTHQKALKKFAKTSIAAASARGLFIAFIIVSMMSSIALIVWYGTNLLAQGLLDFESFSRFLLFSIFVGGSFGAFPEILGQLNRGIGAIERLNELFEIPSESALHKSKPKNSDSSPSSAYIEFRHVTFAYPSRANIDVLKDLSFSVQKGEKIAIVGASGSGKSTILQLLQGLLHPQTGEIWINAQTLPDWNLENLRKKIALVPQEILLFGGTIRKNIQYGNLNASAEQLIEASKLANAESFIEKFPDQFETRVGSRGVQLSGGQKQRIAIARAILANPEILLLDEATSALDAQSEQDVLQALEHLMLGKTVLIVAHRLSTVKSCDRIILLHHGQILESGSYEELMQKENGHYKSLVHLQLL